MLSQRPAVVVDTETTGPDPAQHARAFAEHAEYLRSVGKQADGAWPWRLMAAERAA
jgi:hypothetical protein